MSNLRDKFLAMSHPKRAGLITLIVLAFIGAYWLIMPVAGYHPALNLAVVEEGKLLRSAQPYVNDMDDIREEYGIGTVLNLDKGESDNIYEYCEKNDIELVSLDMKADDPPTEGQIDLFFTLMRGETVEYFDHEPSIREAIGLGEDRPERKFDFPILIHCKGGADRTGVMVALYRMSFQDWSLDQAKSEMVRHWHIPFSHPAQFEFLDSVETKIHPFYGSPQHEAEESASKAAAGGEGG